MNSKRKNIIKFSSIYVVGLLCFLVLGVIKCDEVKAWNYSSVSDCISKSKITDYNKWTGDSGINWACGKATSSSSTTRYCVMWIGTKTSLDIDLQVGRSNSISANVWGMCANSESHGGRGNIAKWITIKDDHGAFSTPGDFMRGGWGDPTSTPVTIDVDKFESGSGVSVRTVGNKKEYTRTVGIYRCNGGDPTEGTTGQSSNGTNKSGEDCSSAPANPSGCNCDWEYPTITLIDPIPQYTLTAYAVTEYKYENNKHYHKFLKADGTVSGWLTSPPNDSSKIDSKTVDSGSNASVDTSSFNPTGYFVTEWGSTCSESNGSDGKVSSRTCTKNELTRNFNVYLYFKKTTTFKGKTSALGTDAGDNTTGWQNTNTAKRARITNCSSTSGCKVTFTHNMIVIDKGGGSSGWSVTRSSNLTTTTKGISTNRGSSASSGSFSNSADGGAQVSSSGELTLWPGMIVCETLSFKPNDNPSTTSDVYTRVCVSAEGDAQPPCTGTGCTPGCDTSTDECGGDKDKDPTGANTLINEKVKNNNVSAYSKYQKVVYAKPGTVENSTGDKVTYRATYNPVLQYTYYIVPEQMQINGGTVYSPDAVNRTIGTLFDAKRGSLQKWNNAFRMWSVGFGDTAQFGQDYKYDRGKMDVQKVYHDHFVKGAEVGNSLNMIARTSENANTQTTPSQVNFSNNSGSNLGNVVTRSVQSTASVLVPYNFENTTEVTRDANDPLYAGETASIDFNITTSPKRNDVTDGTYATIVRDAEWELEVCYNGQCKTTSVEVNSRTKKGDLNGDFKLGGDKTPKSISINVPDVPAGTDICIRSMVKPAKSGADTNWNNPAGNGEWAYSEQKCFKVAKKPSMQVWGGNTYSNGIINMADAIKNNLAYYSDAQYQVEAEGNANKTFAFGSWTELGLISNGGVRGLSSGASLGYADNNDGSLWPGYHPADGFGNNNSGGLSTADKNQNPGGSSERSLCKRSPLTFPNVCTEGSVGGLGNTVKNTEDDKDAILSTFIFGGGANIESPDNVTLNNSANKREGSNIYYYEGGDSALKMAENTSIAKGTIQVVHSTGNIEINGNQEYADSYTTLEEIPKLIVYSEGEIRIGCGVTRIDAVLIAESVLTCNSVGGDGAINSDNIKEVINESKNSNQLNINGAVIANELYPNRTYGAATGANSIIPAEIINFDPTLYAWGTTTQAESGSGDGGGGGSLDITYRRELAPRL